MKFSFFLSRFENSDFITKNKARIFLYYSFFMLGTLPFVPVGYLLLGTPLPLALRGGAGSLGIAIIVLASLAVLRSGRLDAAIFSYAIPTITAVFAIRILNAAGDPATAFTSYVFYMGYLIVFMAAFGRRWQVPLTTLIFFINNVITLLVVQARAAGDDTLVAVTNTGFVNSSIGMVVTGISAYALVSLMNSYTKTLKDHADSSRDKMARIETVIGTTRDGLDVGSSLVQEAVSMRSALDSIKGSLDTSRQSLEDLSHSTRSAKQANDTIVGASAELSRAGSTYQVIAGQASAAVSQMTASIQGISSVSGRSRDSMKTLESSIHRGEEAATGAGEVVKHLEDNANNLLSIVDVITGIASQTNLLAMNAAIEAAHAGESGKGFGVVADEIRRLAEETAQNIQAITGGLQGFIEEVSHAGSSFDEIGSAFSDITGRSREAMLAFEEIMAGLREMSAGTSEITNSVSAVVDSSNRMSGSISSVDSMVADNNRSIDTVSALASTALAQLERVQAGFGGIVERAGTLQLLGQKSSSNIATLDEAVRKLKENEQIAG